MRGIEGKILLITEFILNYNFIVSNAIIIDDRMIHTDVRHNPKFVIFPVKL